MESDKQVLKLKLEKLLHEISGRKQNTIGTVHFTDDKFIMNFPENYVGYDTAKKTITKFHESGIISDEEYSTFTDWQQNGGKGEFKINNDKCFVTLGHNREMRAIVITFKPNKELRFSDINQAIDLSAMNNGLKPADHTMPINPLTFPSLSYEKMQILEQFEILHSLLNQSSGRFGHTRYDNRNDQFVIKYPSTENGRNDALYFLKKTIDGGFLDGDDALVDIGKLKNGANLSFKNFNLAAKDRNGYFQITFKPKLSDDMVVSNLERAINKVVAERHIDGDVERFLKHIKLEPQGKARTRT